MILFLFFLSFISDLMKSFGKLYRVAWCVCLTVEHKIYYTICKVIKIRAGYTFWFLFWADFILHFICCSRVLLLLLFFFCTKQKRYAYLVNYFIYYFTGSSTSLHYLKSRIHFSPNNASVNVNSNVKCNTFKLFQNKAKIKAFSLLIRRVVLLKYKFIKTLKEVFFSKTKKKSINLSQIQQAVKIINHPTLS